MRILTNLCLYAAMNAAQGAAQETSSVIAEFQFRPASAELVVPDTRDDAFEPAWQTIRLFAGRKDLRPVLVHSDDLLTGRLASDRHAEVLKTLIGRSPIGDVRLEIAFAEHLNINAARLELRSSQRVMRYCPWQIELDAEGWSEPILFPAGYEKELTLSDNIEARFLPLASAPHAASFLDCPFKPLRATKDAHPEPDCTIYLVASTNPIEDLPFEAIEATKIANERAVGSALQPTELEGTAICAITLRD